MIFSLISLSLGYVWFLKSSKELIKQNNVKKNNFPSFDFDFDFVVEKYN